MAQAARHRYPSHMLAERLLAVAVCLAGAGVALAALAPSGPAAVATAGPVSLSATPLPLNAEDRAQQRIGALHFLGGLRLTSPDPLFGGLSGLRWQEGTDGGWLLAVSDTGNWLRLRPVERGGRLVGVEPAWLAPILMADGRPAADKAAGDAEALELSADGTATVSFEQTHRLQRYRGVRADDPASLSQPPVAVLHQTQTIAWPRNGGGEAVAALDPDRLLLFAEQARGPDGHHDVLLVTAAGATRLAVAPPAGFSPTDAVRLDARRLLLLTRRADHGGMAARLLLVDLSGLMASGPVPTDLLLPAIVIAELRPPLTVDNMEGLALRCEGGAAMLYLVSDDNLSDLQRTLLLKFRLDARVSGAACAPRP